MSDNTNRRTTFSAFNIPFGEAEDRNGVSLNRNSRGVTPNSSSKAMTPSSRFRNGSRGTKRPNPTEIKNIADQLFNEEFFNTFIEKFRGVSTSGIHSKDNIAAKINESLNALGYMCCAFNGIYSKKKIVEKNGEYREEYEPLGIPKGVYEPLKTLFQLIKRIEKDNSEYFKRADQGVKEIIAELKGLYENMENNQTSFGGVKELIENNKLVVAQFRRTNKSSEKTVQQKDAVEGFVPESIDPFIQSSLCYDKYFTGLVSSIVNFVEFVLKQERNDKVTPFIKQLYNECHKTYYISNQKDDKGTVDKNIILYCSLMIVSRIVRRQASFMASSETFEIDPASLSLLFPADKFLNLSVDPKNAEYSAGIKQDEDGIKQDKEITIGEICEGFSAKKFKANSLAGEDEIPNSGAKHFYPKPMLDAGFEAFYLRANKHGVNINDKESFRIGCDKNFGLQKKLSLEFDQYSNNKLEKIRKLVNLVNKSPILTEEEKSSLRRFSIPFHLLDSKRRINSNNAIVIGHLKCISQEVRKEVERDNPSFPEDTKEDEDNKEIGGSRKNVDTGTQTETEIQAETKTQFKIEETESFAIEGSNIQSNGDNENKSHEVNNIATQTTISTLKEKGTQVETNEQINHNGNSELELESFEVFSREGDNKNEPDSHKKKPKLEFGGSTHYEYILENEEDNIQSKGDNENGSNKGKMSDIFTQTNPISENEEDNIQSKGDNENGSNKGKMSDTSTQTNPISENEDDKPRINGNDESLQNNKPSKSGIIYSSAAVQTNIPTNDGTQRSTGQPSYNNDSKHNEGRSDDGINSRRDGKEDSGNGKCGRESAGIGRDRGTGDISGKDHDARGDRDNKDESTGKKHDKDENDGYAITINLGIGLDDKLKQVYPNQYILTGWNAVNQMPITGYGVNQMPITGYSANNFMMCCLGQCLVSCMYNAGLYYSQPMYYVSSFFPIMDNYYSILRKNFLIGFDNSLTKRKEGYSFNDLESYIDKFIPPFLNNKNNLPLLLMGFDDKDKKYMLKNIRDLILYNRDELDKKELGFIKNIVQAIYDTRRGEIESVEEIAKELLNSTIPNTLKSINLKKANEDIDEREKDKKSQDVEVSK